MTTKTIISRHTLSEMTATMTEVQALTTLSRMRAEADREGLCVTRVIVGGKVREMTIWKR